MKHLVIGLVLLGMLPVAQAHDEQKLKEYYMERSRLEGTPTAVRKLGDSHSLAELEKMQFEIDNAVLYKKLGIKTQARHDELRKKYPK